MAIDRYLTGPCQSGTSRLPGLEIRLPVDIQRLLVDRFEYRRRENPLDEDVLLEDDFLACIRPHRLEDAPGILGPIVPGEWGDDGLHICDALHCRLMTATPVEQQWASPVVTDQRDVLFGQAHDVHESLQILGMSPEPVGASALCDLGRVTHPDQIGCDAPT